MSWIEYRRNHSITDDAFVEAHIVNVAPQLVSGRIVRFLVDENDRVVPGAGRWRRSTRSLTATRSTSRGLKLDSAAGRAGPPAADLDRVRKEVPIQIEIARRTLAAAAADRAKAEESLKLTADDVEKGIDEARAGRQGGAGLPDAGRAGVRTLHPARTARGQRRCSAEQQVTQSRDSASGPGRPGRGPAGQGARRADPDRRRPPHARGRAEVGAEGGQGHRPRGDRLRPDPRARAAGQGQGADGRAGPAGAGGRRERPGVHPGPGPVPRRGGQALPPPGRLRSPAGSPLLSMYNPDLLYVEANLEEDRLPGVEPGNPVRIDARRLRRAVPGPGRLGQQVDRGPVRPDAAQRRLRRVHPAWSSACRCGSRSSATTAGRGSAPGCRRRWPSPMAPAMPPGPRRRPGRWPSSRRATTRPPARGAGRDGDAAGTRAVTP